MATLAPLLPLAPEAFFTPSPAVATELRGVLRAFAGVLTDGFDAEQIWEQLRMKVC
jgi:hypothetical protein